MTTRTLQAMEAEERELARRVREYDDEQLARIPLHEYRTDDRRVPNLGEER